MAMKTTPECPRCGRHTIVQQSETRWTCLNCNFSKDLSYRRHAESKDEFDSESQSASWLTTLLLTSVMLVVMMEVAYGAVARHSDLNSSPAIADWQPSGGRLLD